MKFTKHSQLYYSLFRIELSNIELSNADMVPLITIGLWAFVESIGTYYNKNSNCGIDSFFGQKAVSLYNKDKDKNLKEEIKMNLKDLRKRANLTKHSASFSNCNDEIIVKIMETLNRFLLDFIKNQEKEAASSGGAR